MLVLGEVKTDPGSRRQTRARARPGGWAAGGWRYLVYNHNDSNVMVAQLNYDKKRERVAARPVCRPSQSAAALLTGCQDVKCNQQPPPPRAGAPWLW